MKIIGIFLITVIVLVGCSSNPNEKYIKEIDGLSVKIKSAGEKLTSFGPKRFVPYMDTISFDVKFIHQEFTDTLNLDMANKIEIYYRLIKSISKFEKAYNDQNKDIEYSSKQLNDLKSDLSTGVIDSTGITIYLPVEVEAVDRLIESNSNLKVWYDNIEDGLIKHRKPIDSLIASINEKSGF